MSEASFSAALAMAREQLLIAPYHPDRLRRPAARPGAIEDDRFHQALLWNIFRTFELLPPAFWLRRLQARLHSDWFPAAPETVRVALWRALPLPPTHRLEGPRSDVVADVMVETEHAVWALILDGKAVRGAAIDSTTADSAALLIDATSWYAGTRDCSFGVILGQPSSQDAAVAVVDRYFRSKESLRLRSDWPVNLLSNVRSVGSMSWTDLAAILRDCERAEVLTDIDRALARNVVTWLERVGSG